MAEVIVIGSRKGWLTILSCHTSHKRIFFQLTELYASTDNTEYRGIIDSLDSIMRVRLLKNAYSETITSYVLSGNGRHEIREQYKAV